MNLLTDQIISRFFVLLVFFGVTIESFQLKFLIILRYIEKL